MKPVVIHGGGQEITQVMAEAGIEPRWVQGQRYTDRATLEIATRVLAGDICNRLVDEIRENDQVKFEEERGKKGMNAVNVQRID